MRNRPYRRVVSVDDVDAWLAARRSFITASEAGGLLGLGPRSAASSLREKLRLPKSVGGLRFAAPRMAVGHVLEAAVLHAWGAYTDRRVRRCRDLLVSTRWPWLAASCDGWAYCSVDGGLSVVDIKTTKHPAADLPPPHYEMQIRIQMAVTGVRNGWLVTFHEVSDDEVAEILDRGFDPYLFVEDNPERLSAHRIRWDAGKEADAVTRLYPVWYDHIRPNVTEFCVAH